MSRCFIVALLFSGSFLCTGCGGPSITTNPAPVEVTFQVTRDGRRVSDLSLNLQPIASGTEASGGIDKGVATLSVTPGTYTYFVSQGKNAATYEGIPEAFRNGAMDRRLVIEGATTIELALD